MALNGGRVSLSAQFLICIGAISKKLVRMKTSVCQIVRPFVPTDRAFRTQFGEVHYLRPRTAKTYLSRLYGTCLLSLLLRLRNQLLTWVSVKPTILANCPFSSPEGYFVMA